MRALEHTRQMPDPDPQRPAESRLSDSVHSMEVAPCPRRWVAATIDHTMSGSEEPQHMCPVHSNSPSDAQRRCPALQALVHRTTATRSKCRARNFGVRSMQRSARMRRQDTLNRAIEPKSAAVRSLAMTSFAARLRRCNTFAHAPRRHCLREHAAPSPVGVRKRSPHAQRVSRMSLERARSRAARRARRRLTLWGEALTAVEPLSATSARQRK
jgi:hypothetical protein